MNQQQRSRKNNIFPMIMAPKNQNNSDVTKWLPLQISWSEEIEMRPSLRQRQVVTSDNIDNARDKKHPIMLKLEKNIHKAQLCHKTPFQIMTSKSRQVLNIMMLFKNWSINDVKDNFSYPITTNNHIQITLWLSMQCSRKI